MKFQLLAIAALSGISAALPGNGWGDHDYDNDGKHTTTAKAYATTTSAKGYPTSATKPNTYPSGTPSCPQWPTSCYLSEAKATSIIATYESLLARDVRGAEFNATADALLDATYTLTSNSFNAEGGLPANGISLPNKYVFMGLFSGLPKGNGETTLDIFNSCNKIAWRWTGINPAGQLVKGMTMMNITPSLQIGPTFTEYFNPTLDRCTAAKNTTTA